MGLPLESKILVIDDMKTMRKIVTNMLSKMGYKNIDQAEDGIPAWEKIENSIQSGVMYDFIVSDWNMPGMTGIDLLKKVRETEAVSKTPFLMVTAEAEQSNVVTAIKAGVSNYIVKPFSAVQLQEKMDKIFNK